MLSVLASGKVVKAPKTGTGQKGTPWCSLSIRCPVPTQKEGDDDNVLANLIGFGPAAERLGRLDVGDSISVSGDGKLNHWQGQDGEKKTCLAIVVSEVLTPYTMKKKRGEQPEQLQNRGTEKAFYAKRPRQDDFNDEVSF